MDNTQQIMNNSLVGRQLVNEDMFQNGIQMLDAVLLNNDIKIPDAHINNLRRYMYVSNQAIWNTSNTKTALASCNTIIDSALKEEPGAAYLLNVKGTVYLRMGENDNAIKNFEKALQSSPTWLMPKYFF